MSISTTDINISLEPHLIANLQRIYPLLPLDTARQLEQYIADPPPNVIPYNILFEISQWARSEGAKEPLKSNQLDPLDYSMIALLAGSTTSPERKFGTYVPPKDPEQVAADRMRERKAITYLVNALLSVGCVGFAAWWAADKTGWKDLVSTPGLRRRVLIASFLGLATQWSGNGLTS